MILEKNINFYFVFIMFLKNIWRFYGKINSFLFKRFLFLEYKVYKLLVGYLKVNI